MQSSEIKEGLTYTGRRWKGDRKVTQIIRHRSQEPLVHYIDMRTGRTGNGVLSAFASSADGLVAVTN